MEGLSTPVNSQDVQENKESPDATLSEDTGSEPPKSGLQKGRFYNPDAANKKAVIIRAGKIAIPPTAQLLASNMKKAFSGIPSTQKTIDNFTKKYLVDGRATENKLSAIGYQIVRVYSSKYSSARAYKSAVKAAIQDPKTSLVLFYGHGDTGNGEIGRAHV